MLLMIMKYSEGEYEHVDYNNFNSINLISNYNSKMQEMYDNKEYCKLMNINDTFQKFTEFDVTNKLKAFFSAVLGVEFLLKGKTLFGKEIDQTIKKLVYFEKNIHLFQLTKDEFNDIINIFLISKEHNYGIVIS